MTRGRPSSSPPPKTDPAWSPCCAAAPERATRVDDALEAGTAPQHGRFAAGADTRRHKQGRNQNVNTIHVQFTSGRSFCCCSSAKLSVGCPSPSHLKRPLPQTGGEPVGPPQCPLQQPRPEQQQQQRHFEPDKHQHHARVVGHALGTVRLCDGHDVHEEQPHGGDERQELGRPAVPSHDTDRGDSQHSPRWDPTSQ